MGRSYVTRMVVRRAARFASKIGLDEPFLAEVAEIDRDRSEWVRRRWPFLRDRRIDAYSGITERYFDH